MTTIHVRGRDGEPLHLHSHGPRATRPLGMILEHAVDEGVLLRGTGRRPTVHRRRVLGRPLGVVTATGISFRAGSIALLIAGAKLERLTDALLALRETHDLFLTLRTLRR
jgi:hypothetical protein